MCIWRSPHGVSVTTMFSIMLVVAGASAPCSVISSWTLVNQSSDRNSCFDTGASWGGIAGSRDITDGPADPSTNASRRRIRSDSAACTFSRHGGLDPRGAHRIPRPQPQVAERATEDRHVDLHQLRHLHPALPAA